MRTIRTHARTVELANRIKGDIKMNTLYLTTDNWDLAVDANHNIALATDEYALAQDVASECKLFLGEFRYDTTKGVPYEDVFRSSKFNRVFYESQLEKAALNVPEVAKSRSNVRFEEKIIDEKESKKIVSIGGSVKITTDDGRSLEIGL